MRIVCLYVVCVVCVCVFMCVCMCVCVLCKLTSCLDLARTVGVHASMYGFGRP